MNKNSFAIFVLFFFSAAGCLLAATDSGFDVVIWNQHNGTIRDRGSKKCTIEIFNGSTSLWKREKVDLAWDANSDPKTVVSVPTLPFSPDRIRITITEWIGHGGGLSEVELLRNGENFARQCKVTASAMFDNRFRPDLIIDGITSSAQNFIGYWLLPDQKPGWVELQFPKR